MRPPSDRPLKKKLFPRRGASRRRRSERLRHSLDRKLAVGNVHYGHAGDLAYPALELLVTRRHDVAPVLLDALREDGVFYQGGGRGVVSGMWRSTNHCWRQRIAGLSSPRLMPSP